MSYRLTASQPLFETFVRDLLEGQPARAPRATARFQPPVDVIENDQAYLIQVELPGFDPATLELTWEGRTLTLKGEKQLAELGAGVQAHLRERRAGTFERRFAFPVPVDGEAIEARFDRGVLSVTVAKRPEAQARKIEIQLS